MATVEPELRAYVIGRPDAWRTWLPADALPADAIRLDAFTAEGGTFARRIALANGLAFGDLGMPRWVLTDCALVPSGYFGFACRAEAAPPALASALGARSGWVPLSGFGAACTLTPGVVSAFSLFSHRPGLGGRSKALGLLALGARVQTGVAQYDNPVLRTHTRFGPLEVLEPKVAVHERPATTFVYRCKLPAPGALRAFAHFGERPRQDDRLLREVRVDDTVGDRIERGTRIVTPGHRTRGGDAYVCVEAAP